MKTSLISLVILIAIIFLGSLIFKADKKDWTLSLYGHGETLMRLKYGDLQTCLKDGITYSSQESVERFDCGLKCTSSTDLTQGGLCKQVCDMNGCKN